MNNNKLPYSLNNMAPSFKSFGSNSTCNEYEIMPPVYLTVRREVFLHIGIGNPLNPLDFESIAKDIIVASNDVNPPLARVIPTLVALPMTINPCEDPSKEIPAFASLTACRVLAGGMFSVVVYSPKLVQMFNSYSEYVGLDQILDYFSPTSILPSEEDFDIDIDLMGGGSEHPTYIGYTDLLFVLDNPNGDPNGPGTYVFTVLAEVKIKYTDEHHFI